MTTTKSVSINSEISQSPGNIVSDMDGEKVMLSINNGKYYNLGEIGGVIWEQLEQPILVSDIISKLISLYDVSQRECEEQVKSFLDHLNKEKLIIIDGSDL
ncbi:lasso peptide biosynthesis PqqD family chaperone [Neobacillus drentensis]|uniref:lasso peptide biosynthesis PqqD family chaperone n=1 Tax=Neobacillus drentensis TaxID=220684 RepID=UPI002FFF2C26